ncbi:MAG: cysteine desulfurase family protein, partial [Ruminococcus callidus]
MQIYADNAATTKPCKAAIQAMVSCMEQNYGNPSASTTSDRQLEALLQARQDIAGALGCTAREIYFTSGGSEADNQALRSAAYAGARSGKKHLISTAIEHHAILHTLKQLEEEGFSVTLLPVSETGMVTPEAVQAAIRPDTCLVSVMFANNEIGTIEPIAEIGAVCREKGVLFHTDAVQAVGHVPIDLSQLPVD